MARIKIRETKQREGNTAHAMEKRRAEESSEQRDARRAARVGKTRAQTTGITYART